MTKVVIKRSFYRPHPRLMVMNEVVNPVTGEITHPPSRTKQSFKDECDINNILKQYKSTGMLRHINEKAAKGTFADLPAPMEYQDALNMVIQAEDAFAALPSKLRDRFNNDPQEFLAFQQDPRNQRELVELGLATMPAGTSSFLDKEPPAPPPAPPDSKPPAGGS